MATSRQLQDFKFLRELTKDIPEILKSVEAEGADVGPFYSTHVTSNSALMSFDAVQVLSRGKPGRFIGIVNRKLFTTSNPLSAS